VVEEPLTPEFSRYWAENQWKPGANPPRFDKQCLHDYLESHTEWNRKPPAPHLPDSVIDSIRERYIDLAQRFGITL
jgi:phosphoribosylaminoimidazole-succinocarboxamide synthase